MKKIKVSTDLWNRYKLIIEILTGEEKEWKLDEILKQLNNRLSKKFGIDSVIKKRQLQYDLDDVQDVPIEAPIAKKGKGKPTAYFCTDPDYKLEKVPVELMKMGYLVEMTSLLTQIKSLEGISNEFTGEIEAYTNRLQFNNKKQRQIIELECRPTPKGSQFLKPLYFHIRREEVVQLTYQAYSATEQQRVAVHPYLIKEYKSRFYLLAFTEERDDFRIYALDRMLAVEKLDRAYKPCPLENPGDYFKDVMGVAVLKHEPVRNFGLKYTPLMTPYVKDVPIHHSQTLQEEHKDGGVTMGYKLRKNPELFTTIFSYLDHVEIVGDEELRREVRDIAKRIYEKYS
jgi:predicted DNA-binding transcriptional regulator YafY